MSNVMDYPGVDDMDSGFLTEEMGHSHDDTLDGVIRFCTGFRHARTLS